MAAIAAASAAFSTLNLSRTSLALPRRHLRAVITSSLSSASTEFNIKFAPPKPKPQSEKASGSASKDSEVGGELYIPWIVRGEGGSLALKKTPPELYLRAMEQENTQKKKKKDDKSSASKAKPAAEPKYSKAARRFYNERFREPPQRLAKVLAAAGGKS